MVHFKIYRVWLCLLFIGQWLLGYSGTPLTKADFQHTYAVVVGISDYQQFEPRAGDLQFTTKDAELFAEFLVGAQGGFVPYENIAYLLDADATEARIRSTLKYMAAKAGPNDRLIFYFSGHGKKGALLPYDSDKNDRLIPHADLRAVFGESAAGVKLLILDACHSNSIKTKPRPVANAAARADTVRTGSVIVMTSSQSYQPSAEYAELEQGLFSYFLIDALCGAADADEDGLITIRELHRHVYRRVKSYSNGFQVPHTFGRFDAGLVVARL